MNKLLGIVITAFFLILGSTQAVYAANATIGIEPETGTYNKVFEARVVIDGHGERFNAAAAKVELQNVAIEDLTLGDCQFSFLKTPSLSNPSFQGVLLSDFSKRCVLYTLTLIPISEGEAEITLSDGTVKQYGDAAELLSTVKNARFTLTTSAAALSKALPTPPVASASDRYTLQVKIISEDGQPLANTDVVLRTASESGRAKMTTNDQGLVQFNDLEAGIYSTVVDKNGNQLGETIINVTGSEKVLSLSIRLQPDADQRQVSTITMIGLMALGLGALISFGYLRIRNQATQ